MKLCISRTPTAATERTRPRIRRVVSARAMARSSRPSALMAALLLVSGLAACGGSTHRSPAFDDPSLQATSVAATYDASIDAVVFEMATQGDAGSVVPEPAGQVDGAPVLGYVFPTTLQSSIVGFGDVAGTVALAVTSHPDFDDTPLWDEDSNERYDDDGAVYHAHWVVLQEDDRAPGGLAVVQATAGSVLPPTAPMPMYLDSPGFTVIEDGQHIRVVVPADRIGRDLESRVGGVVAFMEVDASGESPLLAVHEVLSRVGDGTPTIAVGRRDEAAPSSWPAQRSLTPDELVPSFDLLDASAQYLSAIDAFRVTLTVEGLAATIAPEPATQVDGAPVLGYALPTTIPPAAVGFRGIDGILALAVTSHPDFDDTPLWDETMDRDYGNDGAQYHVHWVVLVDDEESEAGLSVPSQADTTLLPPTAPMAMYLDSPGYHAFARDDQVHVIVPAWHLRGVEEFSFDAVTARMQLDASGPGPVLRVQQIYEILSGDLSLPLHVSRSEEDPR